MKKLHVLLIVNLLFAKAALAGVTNYVSLSGNHTAPFSSWSDAAAPLSIIHEETIWVDEATNSVPARFYRILQDD